MDKAKIIGINTTTINRYGTYLMEDSEFEFLLPVHTM